MKNCLVVLGMHRSGTSALTGLLVHLGVDLGGKLLETQPDNEKGFFENKFVVQTNDAILEALGSSWDDPFALPDDWQNYFRDSRMAADIKQFLQTEFQPGGLSALKDPRLCRLLPYWLPQFASAGVQPYFAIVIRNPLEIAKSLHARNGFSIEKSLSLWMQYMLDAEEFTRHLNRGFMHFDAMLESPRESVEELFSAASLPLQEQVAAPLEDNLSDFLDSNLRHHTANAADIHKQGFRLAARLYDTLCAIAKSARASKKQSSDIAEIREEFQHQQRFYLNRDVAKLRNEVLQRDSPEAYAKILTTLRQQFEADQLHREYRYIANTGHLNKEVVSLLDQREELTSERNSVREDRDILVDERDAMREDRDALIVERDQLREDRDAIFAERDELRNVRDDLIEQRDELGRERELFVQQHNELLSQREEFIEQREQLIQTQNNLVQQRDESLQERDKLIHQRTELIQQRETAVAEKERITLSLQNEIVELKEDRDRHNEARVTALAEIESHQERIDTLEEELRFFWDSRVGKLYEGYRKTVTTLKPSASEQRKIHRPAQADGIANRRPSLPEQANAEQPPVLVANTSPEPPDESVNEAVNEVQHETVNAVPAPEANRAASDSAIETVPENNTLDNLEPEKAGIDSSEQTDSNPKEVQIDVSEKQAESQNDESAAPEAVEETTVAAASEPLSGEDPASAQRVDAPTPTPQIEDLVPAEDEVLWQPLVFPQSSSPVTSIVIPVFNNWAFTYACLRSVQEHTTGNYEVIVVDNHSTDETPEQLAKMQGISVISNTTNEVFVNACNQAAAQASGQYLMLLNNDTEVCPGWLEAMHEPFSEATTGIVGAKLVYPDGRLQEAGGIIWSDGTGCNYGHGDDPDLPQYNYRKAVDYCSGACLLVRRSIWDELGGFDTRYAPAYYEDTDLCFAARALNYKVVYQPRARIIHFGGASAGKETTSGYKRFQDINQHKFVEKWQDVLANEHVLSNEGTHQARQRGGQEHILIVDHYVPTFDRDSGSQRMISMVQILLDMDYRVSFWPDDLTYDKKYSRALQSMGVETFYGDLHFEDYMKAHGEALDVVMMSRPATARNYLELVKKYTNARTIFDTVDLHFVREQRRLALEVQQWKDLEFYLAKETDNTFVVSPTEKALLADESFADKVAVVSNIHSLEPCEKSFEARDGLLFIGGFAHPPNEEGVLWFIDYVLPQIRNKIPDMHLTIVGSDPTDAVLEKVSDNVTVAGFVEDVTAHFNNSRVFVSPLLHGAGVKGKIGQSFSYGLPVVTTSIGAEGMHLIDGHNALIADTETEFANKIVELYTEQTLWQKLSVNGRKVIEEQFSPATIRTALENVLSTPVNQHAVSKRRKIILHCHLFKNAGSTVDWSLQRSLSDTFVDHRDDDSMRRGGEYLTPHLKKHTSISALSSHHIQFPLPQEDAFDLLALILLRHPIDRARSVYAFERRQDALTPGAIKAKELNFPDYIRWRLEDDVAPTVRNFQCGHLTSSRLTTIERPQYEAALAVLTRAPLVGTVERYDESMILFEKTLAKDFPTIDLSYVGQNVTPNREDDINVRIKGVLDELGSVLADEFCAQNAWDIQLHEDANSILTERLGGVAHTPRLLDNFETRCRLLAEDA